MVVIVPKYVQQPATWDFGIWVDLGHETCRVILALHPFRPCPISPMSYCVRCRALTGQSTVTVTVAPPPALQAQAHPPSTPRSVLPLAVRSMVCACFSLRNDWAAGKSGSSGKLRTWNRGHISSMAVWRVPCQARQDWQDWQELAGTSRVRRCVVEVDEAGVESTVRGRCSTCHGCHSLQVATDSSIVTGN